MYEQKGKAKSQYQLHCCIRDIAVIELLFATGMRISELCSLKPADIVLESNTVLIYGKGVINRYANLAGSSHSKFKMPMIDAYDISHGHFVSHTGTNKL